MLPTGREPEYIHGEIEPGAEVLELGCGAGRVTRALVELGHPVVAVDESEEMLAFVTAATRVHATIEGLDLKRRFPAVVLISYLVDTPVPGQRDAFLGTCRRHVSDDGVVIVQRTSPDWAAWLRAGQSYQWGDITVEVTSAEFAGGVLSVTQEYRTDTATWTHSWRDLVHTDEEFTALVRDSGLVLDRWIDDDREWAVLRPAPHSGRRRLPTNPDRAANRSLSADS
ncbi:class I SAM-dependent methyltransferase [Actinosynnema sp. NPDC059797]